MLLSASPPGQDNASRVLRDHCSGRLLSSAACLRALCPPLSDLLADAHRLRLDGSELRSLDLGHLGGVLLALRRRLASVAATHSCCWKRGKERRGRGKGGAEPDGWKLEAHQFNAREQCQRRCLGLVVVDVHLLTGRRARRACARAVVHCILVVVVAHSFGVGHARSSVDSPVPHPTPVSRRLVLAAVEVEVDSPTANSARRANRRTRRRTNNRHTHARRRHTASGECATDRASTGGERVWKGAKNQERRKKRKTPSLQTRGHSMRDKSDRRGLPI